MQKGITDHVYKNDLGKPCFQHFYGKYKRLDKKTQSDKVLRDKAFKIASNPKFDCYQRRLTSKVYKFFDKKSKVGLLNLYQINNLQMSFANQFL